MHVRGLELDVRGRDHGHDYHVHVGDRIVPRGRCYGRVVGCAITIDKNAIFNHFCSNASRKYGHLHDEQKYLRVLGQKQ